MRLVAIAILGALAVACAPRVDGPIEKQRLADAADAERLTAQLVALPGVVRAEVALHRAVVDPLAVARPPTPSSLSLVVIVDDRADRAALAGTARRLASAIAPGIEPTVVVEVGAIRPQLAKVGPFTVEARSKPALQATLVVVLATIAALAASLAYRQRPRAA